MQADRFQEFGKASVIVGLQYAVEILQGMLDEIRAELDGAKPKRGRPPGSRNKAAVKEWGGWSADPDERKREMARRMAKSHDDGKKLRVYDPRHPGHEAWIKKLRDGQRRIWDKLSPAQRKAKVRRLQAAKRLSLAVAS